GAEARDLRLDGGVGTLADAHHRDHRRDPDHDPEHGEDRARQVSPEGAPRRPERHAEELHGGPSFTTRPSRIPMTRSVSRAMSGSCVITTRVTPCSWLSPRTTVMISSEPVVSA